MEAATAIMEKSKVIRLLELFPEIDEEIRSKRSIVADLEQYYNPISGIQYDGMPKGKNHISSQTERAALHIPDYVHREIRRYESEIEALQEVKVEILREVSRLKLKHKKVIFGFYFNGMKWEQVAERTNYSDRQCKNIRDEALEILLRSFSKNKVLTEYQIKE